MRTGRNRPCECGSGDKYKKCCGYAPRDKVEEHQAHDRGVALLRRLFGYNRALAEALEAAPPRAKRRKPRNATGRDLRRRRLQRRTTWRSTYAMARRAGVALPPSRSYEVCPPMHDHLRMGGESGGPGA